MLLPNDLSYGHFTLLLPPQHTPTRFTHADQHGYEYTSSARTLPSGMLICIIHTFLGSERVSVIFLLHICAFMTFTEGAYSYIRTKHTQSPVEVVVRSE